MALQQALGIANNVVSACIIGKTAYGSKSYIQATGVEKVPLASLSGHSTANGAMITLSTKNMGTATANRPMKSFVVCHHDSVAEISSHGVPKSHVGGTTSVCTTLPRLLRLV